MQKKALVKARLKNKAKVDALEKKLGEVNNEAGAGSRDGERLHRG